MPGHEAWWAASLLLDWLPSLLILALVAATVWALVAPASGRRHDQLPPAPAAQSPLELLRTRYALGEIDTDTFERMLERLLASEHLTLQPSPWPPAAPGQYD